MIWNLAKCIPQCRNAFDFVGVSERPSDSRSDFKCVVADDVANSVCDDDFVAAWRQRWFANRFAGCARARVAAPKFSPPEPSEERTDIETVGFPWPGEWTVVRDEARHKTTVHWKGKDASTFPWGTENDYEESDV